MVEKKDKIHRPFSIPNTDIFYYRKHALSISDLLLKIIMLIAYAEHLKTDSSIIMLMLLQCLIL